MTTPTDGELLERELRVAGRIQRTLVLLSGVEAEGWEIASDYRPARTIGGDFFDVFPILDPDGPRRLGVVIADVSGKGVSAAILMAFVRPVMRSAMDHTADPVNAIEIINQILVNERRTGLFLTMLAGILELDSGRFRFATAGHELPLLVRADGSLGAVPVAGGRLVGMFERTGVAEHEILVDRGDRLVLYTDGITDASAPGGERFGDERLLGTIVEDPAGTAEATCRRLIDAVLGFQGTADPADDLALLVLRRLPA